MAAVDLPLPSLCALWCTGRNLPRLTPQDAADWSTPVGLPNPTGSGVPWLPWAAWAYGLMQTPPQLDLINSWEALSRLMSAQPAAVRDAWLEAQLPHGMTGRALWVWVSLVATGRLAEESVNAERLPPALTVPGWEPTWAHLCSVPSMHDALAQAWKAEQDLFFQRGLWTTPGTPEEHTWAEAWARTADPALRPCVALESKAMRRCVERWCELPRLPPNAGRWALNVLHLARQPPLTFSSSVERHDDEKRFHLSLCLLLHRVLSEHPEAPLPAAELPEVLRGIDPRLTHRWEHVRLHQGVPDAQAKSQRCRI